MVNSISCRNVKNTHYRFQASILEYMYNDEFGINLGQQCHIVQCVKEDYVLLSPFKDRFCKTSIVTRLT